MTAEPIAQSAAPPLARMRLISRERLAIGLVGAMLAGVFLARLGLAEFNNDDFIYLTQGYQILHGEVPHRDFGHPGAWAQIYLNAALQAVFGHRLLGEALFASAMIAIGTAITAALSMRLSGSLVVGVGLSAMTLLTFPRIYNYPKVIVLALALAAMWMYWRRPSPKGAALLGAVTAAGFYFRHDFVVYLTSGCVALLLAIHGKHSFRSRLAIYVAVTVTAIVPLIVFLQFHGGAASYARQSFGYVQGVRQFESSYVAPRFQVDWSAPLVAIQPPPAVVWTIDVAWPPALTEVERRELEQRFDLRNGRARDGRWSYDLVDAQDRDLRPLLEISGAQVAGVDGASGRPTAGPREGLVPSLQRRFPILRMEALRGVRVESNGLAWMFYACWALPFLATARVIAMLARAGHGALPLDLPYAIGATALCGAALAGLLRPPIEDRLADVAVPCAVLGAWLLGGVFRRPDARRADPAFRVSGGLVGRAASLAWRGIVVVLLLVTLQSSVWVSPIRSLLTPSTLREALARGLPGAAGTLGQKIRVLSTQPPIEAWAPRGSVGLPAVTRYLATCTAPNERLLAMWFAPEIYFYADRQFAAGRLFFLPGVWASVPEQVDTILRLMDRPPTIVVADLEAYENMANSFFVLDDYLFSAYRIAAESRFGGERTWYRIWVQRDRAAVGSFGDEALPCFA